MQANDLAAHLHDLAATHTNLVRLGMESERSRFVSAITQLDHQYRVARQDDNTVIPTPLAVAIESLIGMVQLGASPFTERRQQPRHDDCAPDGRHIEPGA